MLMGAAVYWESGRMPSGVFRRKQRSGKLRPHHEALYLLPKLGGVSCAHRAQLEESGAVLAQSLAIIEYLEEKYPQPPLLPQKAVHRAQVRAMALGIACDVHPLHNVSVTNYLSEELKQDDDAVSHWRIHWIAKGLRALEALVKRHSV